MLCMKGVLCRCMLYGGLSLYLLLYFEQLIIVHYVFGVVNSFGTDAWFQLFLIYTKSQERGETKSQLETLTISHRPLLRLPVAPSSYPAPPYLSSTMAPPLASSLN
ncbi:hypothetical protein HanIR_Chr09g0430201 [Helianthus annuus]|nr:hypothetical protein HanIR_Chr09g0430201 [Helianthus annuus]